MGKGSTTVTQDKEPPAWAEPLFVKSAKEAERMYDRGVGFNPWQGTTLAKPSDATLLGMQGLQAAALGGMGLSHGRMPNVGLRNWGATTSWGRGPMPGGGGGGGGNARAMAASPMAMAAARGGGGGIAANTGPASMAAARPMASENPYRDNPDDRPDPQGGGGGGGGGDRDDDEDRPDRPIPQTDPEHMGFTPIGFQGPPQRLIDAQAGAYGLTQNPIALTNNVLMNRGLSPEALGASGFFGRAMEGRYNPSVTNNQTQGANQLFGQMGAGRFDTDAGDMLRSRIVGSPLSGQENRALGNISDIASGREGIEAARQFQGLINQAGRTDDIGWDVMRGIMGGRNDIGTGRLENLGDRALANPYADNMTDAARSVGRSDNIGQGVMNRIIGGDLGIDTGDLNRLSSRILGQQAGDAGLDRFAGGGMDVSTNRLDNLGRNVMGPLAGQNTLQNIAGNQISIGTGDNFADIARQAMGGGGAADQYLTGMAEGDMLTGNPFLDQMLGRQADEIADQFDARFAASGRYGSGAHQDLLAQNIADMRLQGQFQNYNMERGHQMDAIRQLQAAQEEGRNQALAATQGQTGVQAQNIANRMGAAQTLGGQNLSQFGLAGDLAAQSAGIAGQNRDRQLGATVQQGQFARDDIGQAANIENQIAGLQNQNIQNRMGATGQQQQAALAAGMGQADIYNQLFGQRSTGIGQAMDAAGQVGQFQNQNIQNQMAATQAQRDARERSIGQQGDLLGALGGFQSQDIQNILGASGMQAGIGAAGQDRLMDAISGIQRADEMNAANRLASAQGLAGQGQNRFENLTGNLMNRFGAAQAGADIGQSGIDAGLGYINALPTLQQNRVFDSNLMLQSGAMQDQLQQAALNDTIRRFYETDMNPITRLGFLQAAAGGAAGPYGQTVQTTQQPFNPFSAIGALGSIGSLFGI